MTAVAVECLTKTDPIKARSRRGEGEGKEKKSKGRPTPVPRQGMTTSSHSRRP